MMEMKVSEQLRKVIETSGVTRYAIAKATGIEQSTLSRFMAGKRINLDMVDTLAEFFNLRLAPAKEKKSTRR